MTKYASISSIPLGYNEEARVMDCEVFEHDGKDYVRLSIDRNVGLGICEFAHLDKAKAAELILFLQGYIGSEVK